MKTVKECIEDLRRCMTERVVKRVVIIPHISPDGDAAGACSALAEVMERLGVKWRILTCDYMPEYLLRKLRMLPLEEALKNIHFPETVAKVRVAQLRLKFDELFFIQLHILQTAHLRKQKLHGILFPRVGDYFNTF